MEKFWELEPSKVQVKIKDEKHLTELFKMCKLFGVEICISDYKLEYKYFRKNLTGSWYSNYIFNEDYTEVTTTQFYEILSYNYGYQGDIEGFDKDVVLRMLEYQAKQGDRRDIKEFERNNCKGFIWRDTCEGRDFWEKTIEINKGKFQEQIPATSQELETETQIKEVERLNAEIESLKFKNAELESEQIRLRNINKIMTEELTSVENSYRKLKKKNKKLKKLVRSYLKE